MFEKIVVLDADSLGEHIDLTPLSTLAHHVDIFSTTDAEQTLPRIIDADVIISNKVVIDNACILQASRLKLICVAATGVNNIDVEAAKRAGIVVSNVVNYGAETVAQHTFALLLSLTNRVADYHSQVVTGEWSKQANFCLMNYPITELSGKTLLLCGYGAIGKAVERIAQAFGMHVLIAARKHSEAIAANRVDFNVGLQRADVVSIHCPLNASTHHLFSTEELSLMKPSALLINTARGGIVDEAALKAALLKKDIAGAGFDVLTEEPPRPDHLLVDPAIPNLMVTPHCAWTATEARQRLVQQVIDNIAAYLKGTPTNQV